MTLRLCHYGPVGTITAKELHLRTKDVLNEVEAGASLLITRNGKTIGRIEPVAAKTPPPWDEIMAGVWADLIHEIPTPNAH